MSKEYLEAFNRIALHAEYDNDGSYDCLNFEDDCKLVDEALTRLDLIENIKPSEVLKYLEEWYGFLMADNDTTYSNGYENEIEYNRRKEVIYKQYNTIKQALFQAQKDKAKIEKLKHDNAILNIQLDTFKKLAFKKNKGE